MKIRQFSRDDLRSIVAIQDKCSEAARWLESDYSHLADGVGGMILVAELPTITPARVVGFAAFRRLIDEAEMMNLAVDPTYRRRGIGRSLLTEARTRLIQSGVKRLFLEVRSSNKPALGLYYSVGFALRSFRRDYYRDPREDAYVLCLELSPAREPVV